VTLLRGIIDPNQGQAGWLHVYCTPYDAQEIHVWMIY
jgi:hypothetical protein